MKKLSKFLNFDADTFFKGKKILVVSSCDWCDYNQDNKIVGAKYKCIIIEDNTDYGDSSITNVGESVEVKVFDKKPLTIPRPSVCTIINPKCSVYGEYRNQLSVKADDLKISSSVNNGVSHV